MYWAGAEPRRVKIDHSNSLWRIIILSVYITINESALTSLYVYSSYFESIKKNLTQSDHVLDMLDKFEFAFEKSYFKGKNKINIFL